MRHRSRIWMPLVAAISAASLLALPAVQAATYDWIGGTGAWDTTTANWSGAGSTWPSVSTGDDDAVFGGTAGTVTLSTGITANGLTFTTTGYVVTGDTLTLDGTTPTVAADSGVTATIGSILAGAAGFTKSGAGGLSLDSSSVATYSGNTNVLGGSLDVDYSNRGTAAADLLPATTPISFGSSTFGGNKPSNARVIFKNSSGGGATTQSIGNITAGRGINYLLADPASGTSITLNTASADMNMGLGGSRGWNTNGGLVVIGVMSPSQESQLTFNMTSTSSIDNGGEVTASFLYTLDGGATPANFFFATKSGNLVSRRTSVDNVTGNYSGGITTSAVRIDTTAAGQSWTSSVNIGPRSGFLFVGAHDYSITGSTVGNLPGTGTQNNRGLIFSIMGTGNLTVTSQIIGSSPAGVTKHGPGTLIFDNATNSYPGVTNVNSGTLSFSNVANGGTASDIGASTNIAANLNLNGGTLRYTGAAASTDRLFRVNADSGIEASGSGALFWSNVGSYTVNSVAGPKTLTLSGTNTGDNTLSGVLGDQDATTGRTSLAKAGVGKWVLAGANTYSGNTGVSSGTLALASTGSIDNSLSVRIGASGTFDVTAKSFTMPTAQTFVFELNPAGAGSAGLLNASSLDISAATVEFSLLGALNDPVYILANYSTLTGSQFLNVATPAGYELDYNYLEGNQIALVVPEPGTLAWAAVALAAVAFYAPRGGFVQKRQRRV